MKKFRKTLAVFLSVLIALSGLQGMLSLAKADGIQSNLLVQYNFDETSGTTAHDASGHGNDGTLSSGASWGTGKDNGGVVLNGSNGYVTIPKGVMNGVHNVTVMADVYVTSAATNRWLFGIGPNSGTYIFVNSLNGSGHLYGAITTNGTTGNGYMNEQGVSGSALSVGAWNNVALVLSLDSKTEQLYVNGKCVATNASMTSDPAAMYTAAADFTGYIGKSLYSGDPYFNGKVDNFRIYNTALTSDQLSSILNATVSSVPNSVAVTTTVGTAPVLPALVSATYSDGSTKNVAVTWDAVDPSSYASGGDFTVKGVVVGTSQPITANIDVMDKLALSADNTTAHTVDLNWPAEEGATQYQVYRSSTSGSGYSRVYQGTAANFTDTNLDESQSYYYVVTYRDATSESAYSNEVAVTTKPGTPVAPDLSESYYSSDSATLNWNAVHGADFYNLYRADSAGGTYAQIYSGTALSYTDTGLSPKSTYYYKVTADNTYGESELSAVLAAKTRDSTVADWKFNSSEVKSGTAQSGNLVIKDASGNGNDLNEETFGSASDWSQYVNFSDDKMTADGQGSIQWTAANAKTNGTNTGADFITTAGSPISKEQFTNGYTMELLYKFPSYWTTSQAWMSFLQRSGEANSISEPQGTFNIALSNCKETQVESSNAADNTSYKFDSAWGVTMDEGDKWYEITVVNDTKSIKVYLNGADGFRDITGTLVGIYADPSDGRFRIGGCYYGGVLDKLLEGNLQEVRVSDRALAQSEWLVPDPTQYLQNYGSNSSFTMHNVDDYNMALFPDTQYEIEDVPQTMTADVKWLIDNQVKNRIKSVIHLGDVVQVDDSPDENDRALNIFGQLAKNGVPFFVQPGNHDFYNGGGNFGEATWCGVSSYYRTNWGSQSQYISDFSNNVKDATLTNNSPSGLSSYMIFNAGSYKYMVLSLAWNQNTSAYPSINSNDLTWFENVLKANPNIPTIVTSHDLFAVSPTDPSAITLDNSHDDSANGTLVWNIVKNYNQVFMMVAGHNHGSGMMTLTNNSGNSVIGLLSDYQFAYNGGEGWMKMLEFNEEANKLYISTYSPYAASLSSSKKTFFDVNYLTGTGNYNEIDFNFSLRFSGMSSSIYKTAADAVSTKIASLPDSITLTDQADVQAAQAAYDALTNDEQPLVSNYDVLAADESIITKEINQAAAKSVIDAIAALPAAVTLNDQAALQAAQSAYDALTDDQKAMVTNYSVLTADEARLTTLQQEQAAAKVVQQQIAALPADVSLSDVDAVVAARTAYDALTDEEKTMVTNYATLTADEAAIAAVELKAEKAALQSAIADAQTLHDGAVAGDHEGDYAQSNIDALQDSINTSQAVKNDANATLGQIQAAITSLNGATAAFRNTAVTVDRTQLNTLVAAVTKLDSTKYTQDSWKALGDALAAARKVLAGKPSQEEINSAFSTLQAAQDALTPITIGHETSASAASSSLSNTASAASSSGEEANPKTGQETPWVLYGIDFLLVALVVAGILIFVRSQKRKSV